jgi:TPP-dependent pyruvate/acetoin dehydrogenase alpha subunit
MILMVEANQWAFSTPTNRQTRLASFTEKAPAYGLAAEAVDGTDVLAVYESVRRAADRARAGEGASMVELRYFRRKGHAQHDPQDYVTREAIEAWERLDPVVRFRERLLESRWATEAQLDGLSQRAVQTTQEAADQALGEATPRGVDAVEDVYTDVAMARPWTRETEQDPAAS